MSMFCVVLVPLSPGPRNPNTCDRGIENDRSRTASSPLSGIDTKGRSP